MVAAACDQQAGDEKHSSAATLTRKRVTALLPRLPERKSAGVVRPQHIHKDRIAAEAKVTSFFSSFSGGLLAGGRRDDINHFARTCVTQFLARGLFDGFGIGLERLHLIGEALVLLL